MSLEKAQDVLEGSQALDSNGMSYSHSYMWCSIFYMIYVKVFMYAFITLAIISTNIYLNAYYIYQMIY